MAELDIWAPDDGEHRGSVLVNGERYSPVRARGLADRIAAAALFAESVRTTHVAVVEYHDGGGDTGQGPDVYLGRSWRAVALQVGEVIKDSTGYDDVDEFLEDEPWPGAAALDDGLRQWFDGFREATTVPWVTFSERPVLG